jgi:hypothetical protein
MITYKLDNLSSFVLLRIENIIIPTALINSIIIFEILNVREALPKVTTSHTCSIPNLTVPIISMLAILENINLIQRLYSPMILYNQGITNTTKTDTIIDIKLEVNVYEIFITKLISLLFNCNCLYYL